ncbi:MAG: hypothetical protein PHV82_00350 [Victivallaceae bacterium]|nr:hypothetical protein [Victivallaceae bacterium]
MNIEKNYLRNSYFYSITFICLVSFLLCFLSVKVSVLCSLILASWLIIRAKPDALLGLFLLYFVRYYFYYVDNFVNVIGATTMALREILTFAGFPLQVDFLICFLVGSRVIAEWLFYPETFRGKFSPLIFILWLLAFLPVLAGLYYELDTRSFNWTGGIRYLLITGSYFYGYILAANWPKGENKFLLYLFLPLVFVMLSLMNLHLFWSHHGFLFLGLGGAFAVYFLQQQAKFKYRFSGLLLGGLAIVYAEQASLTIILIVSLAVLLAYVSITERKSASKFRNYIVRYVGVIAVLFILGFTIYLVYYGLSSSDYDPTEMYGSYTGDLSERINAKIFSDRLPLWIAAARQIVTEPEFFVTSVRFLELPGRDQLWMVSCHNTILESLRVNGLFSGTVMLIIMFIALKNGLRVLENSNDSILKSVTAGVLGTAVIGMITGIFPIDMTVGFWLWTLIALCHGIFLDDAEPVKNEKLSGEHPAAEQGGGKSD